jgi:hypothetical protein
MAFRRDERQKWAGPSLLRSRVGILINSAESNFPNLTSLEFLVDKKLKKRVYNALADTSGLDHVTRRCDGCWRRQTTWSFQHANRVATTQIHSVRANQVVKETAQADFEGQPNAGFWNTRPGYSVCSLTQPTSTTPRTSPMST